MSDIFTRDRFRWWDALAADPEMPPGAFIVGYAIATSLQRKSGTKALVSATNDPDDVVCEAWIGAGEIADRISMSTGTVFSMVKKLEQHGYIQIDQGKAGSGHSHHYRLVEKVSGLTDNSQRADHSKRQRADYSEKAKGQRADYSSPEKVSGLTKKGQPADMNPFEPLKETIEEREYVPPDPGDKDSGRRNRSRPTADTETDDNFEEWYEQYPKHADKSDALRAYRAVIKKKLATPDQLLAAAIRHRAERTGQDQKFTKNPATWLNKQSWLNDPANSAAPPGHSHHIDVSAAIARQIHAKQEGGNV
jgi:hypothetical protein